MTVSAFDAANHLCETSGWKVSNLQLQKILYMADMNFTGQSQTRLIDEDFEAWDYGPVLPSLYHKCKAFGSKAIPRVFWGARDISGTPEAKMLDLAWEKLRSASPGQLVETTHTPDGAWVRCYGQAVRNAKISKSAMIDEFTRRIGRRANAA
jgi:uncharacterized phage-associated protein